MTERIFEMDSAVAIAEAPAVHAITPTKTEIATKDFCIDFDEGWVPIKVPADFRIEELCKATGAYGVSELQYDTVIDRYKHLDQGPIQAHHVYTLCASKKDKLADFLAKYKKFKD